MKYKAVVFDLFGTLIENGDPAGEASSLRKTSSIMKWDHGEFLKVYDNTSERFLTGGFKTLEEYLVFVCRELGVPVKPFDINLAKIDWLDYLEGTMAPRMYARETLTQLKKEGYKLALLSNCTVEVPEIWPRNPITDFFDITIFSSTCGLQKPDNRIFELVISELGVKPEKCLFIDDNAQNLAAAEKTGMTAVMIRIPEANPAQPSAGPPCVWNGPVITSIPAVLDILEEVHEV
jgi:putative hydrolase of the HAD superfamily